MASLGSLTVTVTPLMVIVQGTLGADRLEELRIKFDALHVEVGEPIKIEVIPTIEPRGEVGDDGR